MEDTLLALRDGRSVNVGYDTTFAIHWPQHLGGGTVEVDLVGTMVLVPMLELS